MNDPRTTPDPNRVNEDVAARVAHPVTDLNRQADCTRERQLLFGERLRILSRDKSYAYVLTDKDGYVGFVDILALVPDHPVTHRITALGTQAYTKPDMKSADNITLHHGSLINVLNTNGAFAETALGYIPTQHISAINAPPADITDTAQLYLGTPYLWGGNSRLGIDCSGLIQAALTAGKIDCPGDSDQQEQQLGTRLPPDTPVQQGDLFFWKGHVALAVNASTFIHANAHHMTVAYEPITDAIQRIQTQGDGPVTAHKRL